MTGPRAKEGAAPPEDLVREARQAWENAYVPYSGFRVGAALRADDGTIVAGANVENASYGLARCAEQSAVQTLVTRGGRHFGEIVVYTEAEEPASPCGACRQVLIEFAPDAEVFLVNHLGGVRRWLAAELLPGGFRLERDELD